MDRTENGIGGGSPGALLRDWYGALRAAHGHRGWWPGRTRAEIILGAILTQNTAWTNAEKALATLRGEDLLDLGRLGRLAEPELARHLRSAGAFRQKTRTVRAFLRTLDTLAEGSLARMARIPTPELRAALLATWGIGPETADCILLYAFGRPVFVVDAYTKRILARHQLTREDAKYEAVQAVFHESLGADPGWWNDFHAQFVRLGQGHCRRAAPRCDGCPLEPFLPRQSIGKPAPRLRRSGGVRRGRGAPWCMLVRQQRRESLAATISRFLGQ
jgi:endonuclease III related protein